MAIPGRAARMEAVMDWMNEISGMLSQYTGTGGNQPSQDVGDHFDQFTQAAPTSALADALSAAFRSDQTPPFAQMASQLFGQSNSTQQAGMLNTLIGSLGPGLMSQLFQQGGASSLAGLLGSGTSQLTPQQAAQVSPEMVQQIAAHAEKQNPGIIDTISGFYAEHPALVKGLGAAALTVALSSMSRRR
jgi:hypothetical protein